MSEFFAESNEESSFNLFFKRNNYLAQLVSSDNIVDFNFGEKFFYGRVDRYFVPIYFNERTTTLKQFDDLDQDSGAPLKAISFVVDAFKDLAQQFKKCSKTGKISANDNYLSNLTVYKAYEDPRANYVKYLNMTTDVLLQQFRKNDIVFENFDDFLIQLLSILKITSKRYPFTLPAYIKSRITPIRCSGLAVEIADMDPSNDEDKINDFIGSVNWDFYVNACKSYGFMVDKFIPWRLVADIGSAPMIEYSKEYSSLTSTTAILTRAYTHAHVDYYNKFKYYLLNLYNKLKMNNYLVTEDCNGRTVSKIITPTKYSIEKINKFYSTEKFLKLYFQIRFLEEESKFKQYETVRLIDDSLEVYQTHGLKKCLYYFERILNKTFDYSGSLGYIIRQLDARDEAEGL